jgi:hypothetical protein
VAWLALLLGITVLAACFLWPREIGREDGPLLNVRLPRPDLEQLGLRIHLRTKRQPSAARPRTAAAPPAAEPPPAMGAAQPVLTDLGGDPL